MSTHPLYLPTLLTAPFKQTALKYTTVVPLVVQLQSSTVLKTSHKQQTCLTVAKFTMTFSKVLTVAQRIEAFKPKKILMKQIQIYS